MLKRAQRALPAVVEGRFERQTTLAPTRHVIVVCLRRHPAADLAGVHKAVAVERTQCVSENILVAAVAIEAPYRNSARFLHMPPVECSTPRRSLPLVRSPLSGAPPMPSAVTVNPVRPTGRRARAMMHRLRYRRVLVPWSLVKSLIRCSVHAIAVIGTVSISVLQ